MTGVEIFLLLTGAVFMIGSFFISEKLSASELNKIAELSDEEIKKIINKGIERAESQIDDVIDEKMDETAEVVERAMEKESNEKIMAISEYSDTVVESMKRTHDEIMFLYSMLNDKHSELTSLNGDLQRLAADVRNLQENAAAREEKKVSIIPERPVMRVKEPEISPAAEETQPELIMETEPEPLKEKEDDFLVSGIENHNELILQMYREGNSKVDIARKLGLGLGEVSLVIGLYKGEESL